MKLKLFLDELEKLGNCPHSHWTWHKDVPICKTCGKPFGEWSETRQALLFSEISQTVYECTRAKPTPKTEITAIKPQQIELFNVPSAQRSYSYE